MNSQRSTQLKQLFFDFNEDGEYVWPSDDVLKMEYLGITTCQLCDLILTKHQPMPFKHPHGKHGNDDDYDDYIAECRCSRLIDNPHVDLQICEELLKHTFNHMQHDNNSLHLAFKVNYYFDEVLVYGAPHSKELHDKYCCCDQPIINQNLGEIATRNHLFDIYQRRDRFSIPPHMLLHYF